tara:strand:+ start:185 stop:565 length:381 start_codon:yes stop_codon:yes gene_type:complete
MSDLKLTRAGTEVDLGRQGPMNSTSEFGQDGSIFTANADAIAPPKHKVFVAITFVTDTVFNTLTAEDTNKYIGTGTASHNLAAGSETSLEGSAGQVVSGTFTAGMTIHGRWTAVDLTSGSCIAYIG